MNTKMNMDRNMVMDVDVVEDVDVDMDMDVDVDVVMDVVMDLVMDMVMSMYMDMDMDMYTEMDTDTGHGNTCCTAGWIMRYCRLIWGIKIRWRDFMPSRYVGYLNDEATLMLLKANVKAIIRQYWL
jgi:hypothetical protein